MPFGIKTKKAKSNFFSVDKFPNDILKLIFNLLPENIPTIRLVCKHFRKLMDESSNSNFKKLIQDEKFKEILKNQSLMDILNHPVFGDLIGEKIQIKFAIILAKNDFIKSKDNNEKHTEEEIKLLTNRIYKILLKHPNKLAEIFNEHMSFLNIFTENQRLALTNNMPLTLLLKPPVLSRKQSKSGCSIQ